MSVTVDDARRLPDDHRQTLRGRRRGRRARTTWRSSARSARVCRTTRRSSAALLDALGGVPLRMVSQAASRRNITFVIREADLRAGARRACTSGSLRTTGAPVPRTGAGCMRICCSSATAGWASWSERWRRRVRLRGRGRRRPSDRRPTRSRDGDVGRRRRRDRFHRWPTRCRRTCRRWPRAASNVVIGTTGWQAHEADVRAMAERAGIGVLVAAELLDRRERVPAAWSRRPRAGSRRSPDVGAWIHEAHHAAKKDAPSGTALLLQARRWRRPGYTRPIDVSSTRAGIDSRHAHGRLRRPGRDRDADARRCAIAPSSRAARSRRRDGCKGRRGWFTMTRC